jgi:hypothetical protein
LSHSAWFSKTVSQKSQSKPGATGGLIRRCRDEACRHLPDKWASCQKKEERDIGEIFLLTLSSIAYLPSPLNKRRHDYEAKEFKEKNPAT